MESHAQSVDDVLSELLSFEMRPGASYVIDRKHSTFFLQAVITTARRVSV